MDLAEALDSVMVMALQEPLSGAALATRLWIRNAAERDASGAPAGVAILTTGGSASNFGAFASITVMVPTTVEWEPAPFVAVTFTSTALQDGTSGTRTHVAHHSTCGL